MAEKLPIVEQASTISLGNVVGVAGKITVLEALAEDVDTSTLDIYSSRNTTPVSINTEAEDD